AGQLENFAKKDDVLIVISSSGNSVNLVRAVEVARSRGMTVIGLLGFDGGKLKQLADEYLLVETSKGQYGLVEPMHEMVCHLLTACVAAAGKDAPAGK
ncbi:MAG TPA: SIS domain-containing protein, partial [Nitrospiraceae bacterium]